MLTAVSVLTSVAIASAGWQYTLSLAAGHQPTAGSELPMRRTERLETEVRPIETNEDSEKPEPNNDESNTRRARRRIRSRTTRLEDDEDTNADQKTSGQRDADATDRHHAAQFDARDLQVKTFNKQTDQAVVDEQLQHCKAVVERTLAALPDQLTASLSSMVLHFHTSQRRGMANDRVIHLECGGLSDSEIVGVLVHEIGHVADLGAFVGLTDTPSGFQDGQLVIPVDDASVAFYAISWQDSYTHRADAKKSDFISGYAASDAFEDFAESFVAYVLHGDDFRMQADDSVALSAKYDFLRNRVFGGVEYGSTINTKRGVRVWDVTRVPSDTDSFWAGNDKRHTSRGSSGS